MKNKFEEKNQRQQYVSISLPFSRAHVSKDGGWTEYLLADRLLFSHRGNHYTKGTFAEQLHAHDYYELTLPVASDGVEYIADGKTAAVHPGMAILTKPMEFHMFRMAHPVYYDRFVLYFKSPEGMFPTDSLMDFTQRGDKVCAIFDIPDETILLHPKLAEAALAETESPFAAAKAYMCICDLFLALSEGKTQTETEGETAPHFIREIKEYIDKSFLSITSVEELAHRFFYSREYLSRSFRQYYNTPIYEYILRRRMLHCTMLLRQGMRVEDAAHSAGFVNMASFTKLFRKLNGLTPSEYRVKYLRNGASLL